MNINRINVELSDIQQINQLIKYSTEEKKKYLECYSIYRTWITEYLTRLLGLRECDQQISESDLQFKPVQEDKMDIYQFLSRDRLKYFYIRNNIYMERLTKEDKIYVQKYLSNSSLPYNEEIEKFIEKTFKGIIFEDTTGRREIRNVFYGPENENFMCPNNSVVIGMRYDEWNKDGLNDEEWDGLNLKRNLDFLPNLFNKISQYGSEKKLGVPIIIIRYNNFSVKIRGQEEIIRGNGGHRR